MAEAEVQRIEQKTALPDGGDGDGNLAKACKKRVSVTNELMKVEKMKVKMGLFYVTMVCSTS